jgi:hypothetical protein
MSISLSDTLTPVIAGNVVAGLGIMLNVQTLWQHGLGSFKNAIFSDKDRQRWLAAFSFCGQISFIVLSGYQATLSGLKPTLVLSTIQYMFILYGLTFLVHNSLVRLYVASFKQVNLNLFNKVCCSLYILPLGVYVPYWIIISRYWSSSSNTISDELFFGVWEPLFFAVVVGTEVLALISDILLVRRILSSKQILSGATPPQNGIKPTETSSGTGIISQLFPSLRNVSDDTINFMAVYVFIWLTLALDMILKSLIDTTTMPVLFDGAVTLFGLALRASANLNFGTTVKGVTARPFNTLPTNFETHKLGSSNVLQSEAAAINGQSSGSQNMYRGAV